MILHQLRLKNFRGIADREINFPDRGVVVVHGPNEIGKSSVLEALGLLLDQKDSSTRQSVLAVKPVHGDVGSEVIAEISTGPYRFVYRKRFHKKSLTELSITAPNHDQLTGDEAHNRVRAILDETVDTALWDAQRVLQSDSTNAVDLSGCTALTRALDAAAGEASTASGAETLLIDRIDAEFTRYFTERTAKPTKEYKEAIARVKAAEETAKSCREAVADIEERVNRQERLSTTRAELADALAPAAARRVAAEQASVGLTALVEKLEKARLNAAAAIATATASAAAQQQRLTQIADVAMRTVALSDAREKLIAAEKEETAAREHVGTVAAQSATVTAARQAAQLRFDAAAAAQKSCAARLEGRRLADQLAQIERILTQRAEVTDQLAAIALTGELFGEIDESAALVELLETQLRADAGAVEFTVPVDLAVVADGEAVTLAAGQPWTPTPSTPLTVEVPGVITVRIDPGAGVAEMRTTLDAAQRRLATALALGEVSDVAHARAVDGRRRELTATADTLTATRDALCVGVDIDSLRARVTEFRTGDADPKTDPAEAAAQADAEVRASSTALDEAVTAAEAQAVAADTAAQVLKSKVDAANILRERAKAAESELTDVRGRLAASQAVSSDEQTESVAATDAMTQNSADEQLAALTAEYQAHSPDDVAAELAAAIRAEREIAAQLADADKEIDSLTAQWEIIGAEGRQGQLDDAEAALLRIRAQHDAIRDRAEAAKLLRTTMIKHRENIQQRYVEPFRTELERLGRIVFADDSVKLDINPDLSIESRTHDGRTVPYGSLSTGTREQLGIMVRLTGAALVADADTVPVVIDDALGFADPKRLISMGTVFNAVGERGQVILLTCQPDRYSSVRNATVIELLA
ncbi:MAG: AAA family ATPase [Mycobacteriaceae bacterium]